MTPGAADPVEPFDPEGSTGSSRATPAAPTGGPPIIGGMGPRHEDTGGSTLRAPTAHRAVSALACPVIAYFVARLLVRFVPAVPEVAAYVGCLALGLLLAVRAWRARVELGPDAMRVHNMLSSTTVERRVVRRVSSSGRVEFRRGSERLTRLPCEALQGPWWSFGSGGRRYVANRERLSSWTRTTSRVAREDDGHGTPGAAVA